VQGRYARRPVGFELRDVALSRASDRELAAISEDLGLALSTAEMRSVREHFQALDRNPTDVELQSLGQAWSEHCCYKSSKPWLREYIFPVQTPRVLDRGDAGVMEFDADHAYVLRIESHNHPSAVEPYGGAATGIGGILRDVLAMGAQPVALVDPLHFGPLDTAYDELPAGAKHPKYLFGGVVAGIRDYGNRVGIPTVSGGIVFDPGYLGNIIVNVGCVGFAPKRRLLRNRVGGAGDIFVLCGGRTGRDGIHGVTYASLDLKGSAVEEWQGGAVQLGDPIMKEPLIHACIEAAEEGLLRGMKDLGGGGLSCVVGEMALAAGCGAEIDLERVPLKESGLAPWEIWVSESQERMMLAVAPENVERVLGICDLYDVPAAPIGRAIPEPVAKVRFRGETVLEMDLRFYTGGPEYRRPARRPATPPRARVPTKPRDLGAVLLRVLAAPNVASKEYVIRQYDHEVRASTVVKPMQGIVGKATHGDAAVIRPLADSWRALAIATASTPFFTAIDPYRGGAGAVDEVCRNLVAVGARPDAITDCLNFGNPERPDRMWRFREAARGIGDAARSFGVAIPSGNVSLYNESAAGPVLPTPVLMGVGIVEDLRRCITADLKSEGNPLYLVGETRAELGGSEYVRALGRNGGAAPAVFPPVTKAAADGLLRAMAERSVVACHDLSHGGLAVAAAEMAMGGDIGVALDLGTIESLRFDILLFSESHGRWLVEVARGSERSFERAMTTSVARKVGAVGTRRIDIARKNDRVSVDLSEAREAWSKTLPELAVVA